MGKYYDIEKIPGSENLYHPVIEEERWRKGIQELEAKWPNFKTAHDSCCLVETWSQEEQDDAYEYEMLKFFLGES